MINVSRAWSCCSCAYWRGEEPGGDDEFVPGAGIVVGHGTCPKTVCVPDYKRGVSMIKE